MAITGSPPVASSSDAADCEPDVAATQRYEPALASSAVRRAELTVDCPGPPLRALLTAEPPGPPAPPKAPMPPALLGPADGTDPVCAVEIVCAA